MSSQIERKLFTIDDCDKMEQAGILAPDERIELINGEIILVKPTGPRHGAAVDAAAEAMIRLTRGRANVRIQGCVVLHNFAAPLPDITLLAFREDWYARENPGPRDILLVVEVSDSTIEFDTTVKLPLYAIAGVPEYWVADLRNNRLMVYSKPEADAYTDVRQLQRGDVVAPAALPDCRIMVDLLLP
jgi:Uma2 family endonuclease